MNGTNRLDRGPGKARTSIFQLILGVGVLALIAVGCSSTPEPSTPNPGKTTPSTVGKEGTDMSSAQVTPGPGADNAQNIIGTKAGKGK